MARSKGLLPIVPENRGRGRPPEHNRSIINCILWRLRCGAPSSDVQPKYGCWNTVYRRFQRWSEAGIWETVAVLRAEVMADSGHYSIDSTTVRTMSRQRAEKGEPSTRSWQLAGRVHQQASLPG